MRFDLLHASKFLQDSFNNCETFITVFENNKGIIITLGVYNKDKIYKSSFATHRYELVNSKVSILNSEFENSIEKIKNSIESHESKNKEN
jgi:hypothetical protein